MPKIARCLTVCLLGLFLGRSIVVAKGTAGHPTYVAGQYVASSPLAQHGTLAEVRRQARAIALSLPGAFIVRGFGNSMLPLYPSGTYLVVQPQDYATLARGMTVVFRDHNRSITHVLVARTGDGWRTTGLNNRQADYVPVNAGNILGVVVAAFTPVSDAAVALR